MDAEESSLKSQASEAAANTAELLNLSEHPITFEPISSLTNVFFDRDNQQIFCVRSNGVGGVIVKGPRMSMNISFRMEDKGSVASIKFSPNMNILAIRRKDRSVIDFINFKNLQPIYPEFSQTFKAKSPNFQEFYWLDSNDILFVSEQGFEHYQVFPDKRALKFMKFVSMPLNWLIWSREAQVFIVSTGNYGSILNPFLFSKADFVKLPKFEVDLPLPVNMLKYRYSIDSNAASNAQRYFLNESDVVVGQIYGEFYVMIIRQMTFGQQQQQQGGDSKTQRKTSVLPSFFSSQGSRGSLTTSSSSNSSSGFSEIAMYKLFTDTPAKKTNILKIQLSGRFTLNIIDELIVVHHRNSYSSLIFDIKMPGEFDGYVTCNYPIIKRACIQAIDLPSSEEMPTNSGRSSLSSSSASPPVQHGQQQQQQQAHHQPTEMYSMNWIMFLPNIIIDAKLGYFWFMELNLREPDLRPFGEFENDYLRLVEFLLNRKSTKQHVIRVCMDAIRAKSSLKLIEKIFDKINELYKYSLLLFPNMSSTSSSSGGGGGGGGATQNENPAPSNASANTNSGTNNSSSQSIIAAKDSPATAYDKLPIIEQYDMHNLIFYPLMEDEQWWNANSKYTISLLIEYFRSLNLVYIPIEQYFYKLLVNALIKTNRIYQLHQYLQYHVLSDSKPLACLLLGLQETYSPSNQLALDMLKRLGTANEEIVDVLLSKGLILSALRFAIQLGLADELNAAKFLETAKDLSDPLIYYEVFKFFEERNFRLRGNPNFRKDELCEAYVEHFMSLFNKNAIKK